SVAAAGAAATAAATLRDVRRIGDGETATHQTVDVVDLGAFYVLRAQRIDQNAHAFELGDTVVIARLVVQRHAVGRARTTHAPHKDAQRVIGLARFVEQFSDLDRGSRSYIDHVAIPSRG